MNGSDHRAILERKRDQALAAYDRTRALADKKASEDLDVVLNEHDANPDSEGWELAMFARVTLGMTIAAIIISLIFSLIGFLNSDRCASGLGIIGFIAAAILAKRWTTIK